MALKNKSNCIVSLVSIIIFTLLTTTLPSYAQSSKRPPLRQNNALQVGFKTFWNINSLYASPNITTLTRNGRYSTLGVGFTANVLLSEDLGFFLQSEILLSEKGGHYLYNIDNSRFASLTKSYWNLDIPILFGKQIPIGFLEEIILKMYAGTVVSIHMAGNQRINYQPANYTLPNTRPYYAPLNVGYALGASITVKGFMLDIRYQSSFTALSSETYQVQGSAYNLNFKPHIFQIALGYTIQF
ncbi:MAG: hypothetical protein EAZ55_00295 [Cytophagales bacterium]|nr:MAG: hypothetical protein EAZ55_00295 [Cytophagales bacterium]